MKQQQQTHTPEPWGIGRSNDDMTTPWIHGHEGTVGIIPVTSLGGYLGQQQPNAQRIVACVNSMAGISDPAAALQAAREALEAVCSAMAGRVHSFECLSAIDKARAALRQLNGEAQP